MTPVAPEPTTPEETPAPGDPLTVLGGVGPARAGAFARLGIETVHDLLVHAPRGLEERPARSSVAEARGRIGHEVSVVGTVGRPSFFRRGRRSTLKVSLEDATGKLGALWFNQPWLRDTLRACADAGDPVELSGKVVATRSGPALAAPRIGTVERPLPPPGSLRPLYAVTEGVGQELWQRVVGEAVERYAAEVDEPLPLDELAAAGIPPLAAAVRAVHRPAGIEAFHAGRRRLALESVLVLQAGLRGARAGEGTARPVVLDTARRAAFLAALPFRPTAGQTLVFDEVLADTARVRPMRRLLQGDVGSGKTLVAAFAAFAAAAAGGQVAILVPTELLAEQHHLELAPLFARLGIRSRLHTASAKGAPRREVLGEIASGAAQVVVGTHALLSTGVRFRRLDLAVIDEQQRFGVVQKASLLEKGRDVHMLLMSATPIPRTLALTLYGELDVSLLTEHPPGRGALTTKGVAPAGRAKALGFVYRRLAAGERAFWVCPRIEAVDDEAETRAAAEDAYAGLAAGALGEFGVTLVHGRVPADERARRIAAFRAGEVRVLVATTVIEVGVDVPAATVMVIDGAERFGLAQLHQLRGRVGRGPDDAWCLLFPQGAGARDEEGETHGRMRLLEETRDGFVIAEEDLRRRGMGDLAGVRQAGGGPESLLDPAADEELVLFARRLVVHDPDLRARYARRGPAGTAIV